MAEAKTETAVKAKKTTTATAPKKAPAAAKTEKPAVAKTAAAKPAVARKPAAAKAAAKPKAGTGKLSVTPEQRYMMICEAAYYRAERRGFSPENEIQDWLDAEAEINRLLGF
jgi:hypothetical protein